MTTPESDEVLDLYFKATPRASVDRVKFPDWDEPGMSASAWASKLDERLADLVPAEVDVDATIDLSTRELTVTVTADFYGVMPKEYRLNAFVLENDIPAVGELEQTNAPADYDHDHTLRVMLGGAWGTEDSVPNPTSVDGSYSHSYSYVVPEDYNVSNLEVIGLVQRFNGDEVFDREIVNSKRVGVTDG